MRRVHRLHDQTHAQGCANAADRLEARLTAGPKGFVQGFACNAGILRNLRHTACAGNVAKGRGQQRGVILFKNGRQVCGHILVAVQVLRRIKLGKFRNLDSLGYVNRPLSQSENSLSSFTA